MKICHARRLDEPQGIGRLRVGLGGKAGDEVGAEHRVGAPPAPLGAKTVGVGARMPALRSGDAPLKTSVEATQHFTQPPPRYSEASLVKRLEELGTCTLYDRTSPEHVFERIQGADIVLTNKVKLPRELVGRRTFVDLALDAHQQAGAVEAFDRVQRRFQY